MICPWRYWRTRKQRPPNARIWKSPTKKAAARPSNCPIVKPIRQHVLHIHTHLFNTYLLSDDCVLNTKHSAVQETEIPIFTGLPFWGVLSRFSHVQLFVTLWTVTCQALLPMGFSRQEYWNGLPCPPPGDLPNPRIEPVYLVSPALARGFFTTSTAWEALHSSSR